MKSNSTTPIRPLRLSPRPLSGPAVHALMGAIVAGCVASACSGRSAAGIDEVATGVDEGGSNSGQSSGGAGGSNTTTNTGGAETGSGGATENGAGATTEGGSASAVGGNNAGGASVGGAHATGGVAVGGSTAQGGAEVANGGAAGDGGGNAVGGFTTGGTTGDGGASGSGPLPPDLPLADSICNDDGSVSILEGLNPAEPVDYLAVRMWGGEGTSSTLVTETGVPCTGDCAADLEAEPPAPGFDRSIQAIVYEYLVYSSGDTAGTIVNQEELVAFLGTIDTPNEAGLVLWGLNRPVQCDAMFEREDGSYFATGEYMTNICVVTYQNFELAVAQDGSVVQTPVGDPRETGACVGRRPANLRVVGRSGCPTPLGEYFAEVAELESAAVIAFGLMERELSVHGAPHELLRRLRAAARDEVRHAHAVGSLSRRFGIEPCPAMAPVGPVRSLFEIARENAKEGCVRELYGALAAEWQARMAEDAEARRVFQGIAKDEAEHASVSLAVAAWLDAHLSGDERRQIEAEKAAAFAELRQQLTEEPDAATRAVAGVPSATEAAALLAELETALLAAQRVAA